MAVETIDKLLAALPSEELLRHAEDLRGLSTSPGWAFLQRLLEVQAGKQRRALDRESVAFLSMDELVKEAQAKALLRGVVKGLEQPAAIVRKVLGEAEKVQSDLEDGSI